jgi:pimeloyl-ACP methyl ester carboxylesterase
MLTKKPDLLITVHKNEKGCKLLNNTRLYYEVKGEGQPLVFIHDFLLDHRMWDDQFYYFSRWYRCIRLDLRGFGQSALPGHENYTYHDDLKALLFSLDITQPVILVGHSLGGLIAVNFTLKYPRFAQAIVLCGTQIEGYAFKDYKLDSIFNKAKRKGIEYAKRKLFGHNVFAHARKNKPVSEALWQMIHFYSGWHLVDKHPLISGDLSAWENLENITAPALVMCGGLDLPDFREISEAAAFRIRGAKKAIVPDTGHLVNMENPSAFNKELQNFLAGLRTD